MMSSKDCEMGTRSNEGIDGSKSGLASISMRELIRLDRTVLFSILPIPFISYAVDRDERLGIIVAVISGIYVLFLTRNRVRLRWLLFLFGALFFGGAILGLVTGSAKLFFATDPAEDFLTATAMFISIYINRPLAGLLMHEMFPAVRGKIESETRYLKQVTAVVGCVNLTTGLFRTFLLLSSVPVEYFVLISRPIAFTGSGLTVLISLWLLKRRSQQLRRSGS